MAAWSTPSITSLGGTPAYAASCTAGSIFYELGGRNTNCNCNPIGSTTTTTTTTTLPGASTTTTTLPPVTGTVVRYKLLQGGCGSTAVFPGTAVLRNGSCSAAATGNDGSCPSGFTASNTPTNVCVCVSPTNTNLFCRAEVRVYQGGSNCSGNVTRFRGPVQRGAGCLPLPPVSCQAGGNIFVSVGVTCSVERECV